MNAAFGRRAALLRAPFAALRLAVLRAPVCPLPAVLLAVFFVAFFAAFLAICSPSGRRGGVPRRSGPQPVPGHELTGCSVPTDPPTAGSPPSGCARNWL